MLNKAEFQTHRHTHAQNRFAVIPTADKLNADRRFTGKGVCIAFLDSGFYPHIDFADRVIAFHDIAGEERSFHSISEPKAWHWHGTQTVTACAGSGALSDGVYRGIASDAHLVLVKVSKGGGISDESIEKGLLWVLVNRRKYNIRVLNMSLGGDLDLKFAESRINQLAEELIKEGVSITVAAGNSADSHSIPPANSPSVITVGGYSDENQFSNDNFELYHSNFGATIDGLVKPEIIAPAMNIAAPLLPGTEDYIIAETLSLLAAAPDYAFRHLLDEYWQKAGLPDDISSHGNGAVHSVIANKLREHKVIAAHYQHVDGTSFAAPVTASVIVQMLEANPRLTPPAIKNILISTAQKLNHQPLVRQGYGVLCAESAVAEAIRETHVLETENYAPPRIENGKIIFRYHDDSAESVALVSDFNDWNMSETRFTRNSDGVWIAAIDCLKSGKYRYKFCVDGKRWTEDTSHGLKEQDGFGGFHSILIVE